MTEHPELGPPMPFDPSPAQLKLMPKFRKKNIPRYLFRIHTPITAGTTTTSCIIAPASKAEIPVTSKDIFEESPENAGDILLKHLSGPPAFGGTCNLMSWTSSLLFALQYGLHRHRNYEVTLSDIRLLVLDTSEFPKGTFVKDMEIMSALTSMLHRRRDLHKFLDLRENPRDSGKRYYFGEYLSQGDLTLEGRCAETTMETLIDRGLFGLQPELGDEAKWHLWANRVLELREGFDNPTCLPPTDKALVKKAIYIAGQCFGDRFDVPIALMLLTLRPRQYKDKNIVNHFVEWFSPEDIRDSLKDCNIDDWLLPEMQQFQPLADTILDHTVEEPNDLDDLLRNLIQNLNKLAHNLKKMSI